MSADDEALARLAKSFAKTQDARALLCMGPLIVHEDGAIQCLGCAGPDWFHDAANIVRCDRLDRNIARDPCHRCRLCKKFP
jgi:hypothetical protein